MEIDIEDTMGISRVHFLAGALAGTAEHIGMYPVDTIKTHVQAQRDGYRSGADVARDMIRQGGFRSLFKGMSSVIMGAAPAHALYFGVWESCKRNFIGPGHSGDDLNSLESGIAGICATIVSDAVLTPMDAIKQKRQLSRRGYSGTWDCFQKVRRAEGVRALYAGKYMKSDPKHYDLFAHLISGAIAGATAAALTNPLDVAKTRLQTQSDTGMYYRGMFDALHQIKKAEGWRGFSRGLGPRMLFFSMSAGMQWVTYEYVKHIFGAEKYEQQRESSVNALHPPSL